MADDTRKKQRRYMEETDDLAEKAGDWAALLRHMRDNPLLYLGIVAFVFLVLIVGVLYRAGVVNAEKELVSKYARALSTEDPATRSQELLALPKGKGDLGAEIACMAGEAAFRAGQYDKAKDAFERVKTEFPNSAYVAEAMDGLAAVREQEQDYAGALALCKEILEKWPTSFTGRRQPANMARLQEQLGNLKDAVASYQQQLSIFPGSQLAQYAQGELDRLRKSHPDLFEAPPATTADASPEATPAVSPESAPATVPETASENTSNAPAPSEN